LMAMSILQDIKNMTEEGLARWLMGQGVERYRAGQILRWVYQRNVSHFLEMTDLSKDLRKRLAEGLMIGRFQPERVVVSNDGSKKYLFGLSDGRHVEAVAIPERGHWTLCVSSQVGCAMGCRFCLTGRGGLVRSLDPSEIINQVCAVKKDLGMHNEPLTNIVFMGMGEPLANYDNVVQAIRIITGSNGLGFSSRRVTLSTVGLAPRIDELGREITVNLAVSLNAADNATRDRLMPVNRTYPLETLLSACSRFPLPSRRMITFEYVLIAGVNDSTTDAKRLVGLLRPLRAKLNLIPFNPFEGSGFERPDEAAILAFQKVLTDDYYTAMIRWSKGQDIGAACGQLRADTLSAIGSGQERAGSLS
jgi:23S rRNA (adenine2503-C2)-methyltransferase